MDDAGFWPSAASDRGVNAWVALDDMPRAASVKYIKGGGSLIGRILVEGIHIPPPF